MDSAQEDLIGRIRTLLEGEKSLREVSMFGGRSFMVSGRMVASARKGGNLLVRVDADRHEDLLRSPGASAAKMGATRDMGPGWIEVAGDALDDENRLSEWIEVALEFNRSTKGSGS